MLQWFLNLFRSAADLVYLFRCIVCAVEEILTMATAQKKGTASTTRPSMKSTSEKSPMNSPAPTDRSTTPCECT